MKHSFILFYHYSLMQRLFCIQICIFICISVAARSISINIATQDEFDHLDTRIEAKYRAGYDDVDVILQQGIYYYKESHITMKYASSSLNVIIYGNGSVLRGKGQALKLGKLNPDYTYFKKDVLFFPWGEVVQMSQLAEVVDKDMKLCRVRNVSSIDISEGDFIQISSWYTTHRYLVTKVVDNYVYFIASDLSYLEVYKGWNINMDYLYGEEMPRYRIYKSDSDIKDLFETKVTNFIDINNIEFGSFVMQDIMFDGCAYTNWKGMIRINGVKAQSVRLSHCLFRGSQSICVNISNSRNVTIENCTFEKNYTNCIQDDQKCNNVVIRNNSFLNNGLGWTNQMNVRCVSNNFCISYNKFENFGYAAIGAGVWYASKKDSNNRVTGVVENNEIYYNRDYFAEYKLHTLMDSGAIYCCTKNDNVKVRYNYIHDYIGMKDNRGILCDDGTCNVKIYGNLITNTPNGYSIDLRSVPSVEKDLRYDFGKTNVGNEIYDNIIDGNIRFEGRKNDSENGCIKGRDYLLVNDYSRPAVMTSSVMVLSKDLKLKYSSADGCIVLDRTSYKAFMKHPAYKQLKRWVKRGYD